MGASFNGVSLMNFPTEIFKAYDIRGVVGQTLTEPLVEQIGWAIGDSAIAAGDHAVIIGWDGRPSGPGLANALSVGIQSAGCHAVKIGMVPTPVTYFASQYLKIGSAVSVTGSHNPPQYNGLKIVIAGQTLAGQEILDLGHHMLSRKDAVQRGDVRTKSVTTAYIDRVSSDIKMARPLRIAVDSGNGVAGIIAPLLYRKLGCEVIELYSEVDGQFPNHHPDPSQPENLQDLKEVVTKEKVDLGIAFDGDGDRLGVISPDGEIIWPDRQLLLFANDILNREPGAEIIYDVKCSRLLPAAIQNAGGRATMWRTGHSYIKAKLKESGAALAGEMSGHIFFQDRWYGFDDAIYAGARLCELLAQRNESTEIIFKSLPNTINTPELRLEMDEGDQHQLIRELADSADFPGANVTKIDGIRVDYDDGFGLARASNTTPTVIFRFEADNVRALQRIQSEFRIRIQALRSELQLPY
jgi:phosphomannomutase/phosphoglucomutase